MDSVNGWSQAKNEKKHSFLGKKKNSLNTEIELWTIPQENSK